MMNRLGLRSWATGALVLAAVTGCANGGADPGHEPSPTAASSRPTASSPTAQSASPSDRAAADAAALVRRYFATLDEVRSNPASSLSALNTVAVGTQLAAQTKLVKEGRKRSLHQTGSTRIAQLKVQSVNLDNSEPSAGNVPTVTVDVCWDVSGADLVDKDGQSVVTPKRADRGWTRYTVANDHWSEDPSGGWRIASSQDLKQTPCAAS